MCLQITGNTDRYSRVTQYFTYPVITRELALNPISFNQRISLRVNLYGQPLANFNRTVMRFHFYKHWNIYIYQLLFDRRVVLTKFGLGFVQVFYLFLKSLYVLGGFFIIFRLQQIFGLLSGSIWSFCRGIISAFRWRLQSHVPNISSILFLLWNSG